jgi:hypothetical protein
VVEHEITTRAQLRKLRTGSYRGRRLWAVAAVAATVTGLGVTLSPEAGYKSLGDRLLTVQDPTTPETPTFDTDQTKSPPIPDETPTPTPTTSSSSPSVTPSSRKPRHRAASEGGRSSSAAQPRRSRRGVVLDGRTMGGWYAGASGTGVTDGGFTDWLHQPVTVAATWADTSDEVQRTVSGLSDYEDWNGAIDIAVGGTVLDSGENYEAAASGAYDDRWRAAAQVIAKARKGKGPTYVRPFHEMNGDWYKAWTVTRENSADYKKAFARYAGILREAMPEVYISFSPNWGDHTGLPIDYWYPGDNVVDVVAPDYYNDYAGDAMNSVEAWNQWSTEKDKNGNPFGLEAWRQFAREHGKPLAFPEWGLKPSGEGGGDSPEWLKAVNAWMNKNANTTTWSLGADIPKAAAGKVLYSCYFNVVHGGDSGFTIFGHGANSRSASVFPDLRWGNIR